MSYTNITKNLNKSESLFEMTNLTPKDIEDAIDYVCRNLDLFLKHFKMSAFEYDDDDFKDDLRKRGEYK